MCCKQSSLAFKTIHLGRHPRQEASPEPYRLTPQTSGVGRAASLEILLDASLSTLWFSVEDGGRWLGEFQSQLPRRLIAFDIRPCRTHSDNIRCYGYSGPAMEGYVLGCSHHHLYGRSAVFFTPH